MLGRRRNESALSPVEVEDAPATTPPIVLQCLLAHETMSTSNSLRTLSRMEKPYLVSAIASEGGSLPYQLEP